VSLCVVLADPASRAAVDVLERVLLDRRRRRDGQDTLGGRGDPVDDGRRRATRSRCADLRARQPGNQLRRDARRRRRLPLRRTHQLPVLRQPRRAHQLEHVVVVVSVHLPTGHSLFNARVQLSATEASLSQDRVCGTVYRLL